MAQAQHTPGPWFASTTLGETDITADNETDICVMDWARPDQDIAADAALIAAAPSLLDALRLVRFSYGWQHMSDETKAVVVDAIAKATTIPSIEGAA